MEDINDDDAAMMAMMGVTGFGSTKVNISQIYGLHPLKCLPGKTRRWQPGRYCQYQKNEDMATIYE